MNGSEPGPEEGNWADLTLSMRQVVQLAGRWLPAMTVGTFLPYLLLWGLPDLPEWAGLWPAVARILVFSLAAVLVYAVSAVLHEALHVLAMVAYAGTPISSLRFGARLSEGVLYVHSDRPMSARAYRIVLLLPGLVLGILPTAIALLQGGGWLILYGYVMTVSAIGDLLVLQLMRHVDAQALVRDHPEEIGCQVRLNPLA
jgi:hypothetical protein